MASIYLTATSLPSVPCDSVWHSGQHDQHPFRQTHRVASALLESFHRSLDAVGLLRRTVDQSLAAAASPTAIAKIDAATIPPASPRTGEAVILDSPARDVNHDCQPCRLGNFKRASFRTDRSPAKLEKTFDGQFASSHVDQSPVLSDRSSRPPHHERLPTGVGFHSLRRASEIERVFVSMSMMTLKNSTDAIVTT